MLYPRYLVSNVGSGITDITSHFAHDADMLVAVEEGVLVVPAGTRARGCSVCLETRI
jgi:hypothetical protein